MPRRKKLTPENYHQDKSYISSSFVKNFIKCESSALYEREHPCEDKTCFKEGRLFETLVCSDETVMKDFALSNPDMFTKQGDLKANYKRVVNAANKIKNNPFLSEIVANSKQQEIFTGKINGVAMKMMCDLHYKDGSIYDLKCMADFKDKYSLEHGYQPWFESYLYHVQMYIYKEIAEQNGIEVKNVGLIAATKEEVPDVQAIIFSDEWLEIAKEQTFLALERYKKIKRKKIEPLSCGICSHCKEAREITEFEVV